MSEPAPAAAQAAAGPDPMRPERYRIVRTWPETHDTFTMVLAPVEAGTRYRFEPGQFNMLYAAGRGRGRHLDERRPGRRPGRSCTPSAPSAA